MCLVDLFGSGYIDSHLDIESGSVNIYYSAYSTDSSFSEDLEINFCPKCGKSIKSIVDGEKKRLEQAKIDKMNADIKRAEVEERRKELAKKRKVFAEKERIENEEKNRIKRDEDLANGTYFVFSNGKEELIAANKKHLRDLYKMSHKVSDSFKGIKRFEKGVEDKSFSKNVVKTNIKAEVKNDDPNKVTTYEINKGAKINDSLNCAFCGNEFVKKTHAHAFCKTSCKDDYWNIRRSRK